MEIGLKWWHGDGSCVSGAPERQLGYVDVISQWKQFLYQSCSVSAFSWFQWPNCEIWWFVCACARVERTMSKFYNPKQSVRWPTHSISVSRLLLSEKSKAILVTKYNTKIWVSDIIPVLETGVSAQYESDGMATVKLYSSTRPTA